MIVALAINTADQSFSSRSDSPCMLSQRLCRTRHGGLSISPPGLRRWLVAGPTYRRAQPAETLRKTEEAKLSLADQLFPGILSSPKISDEQQPRGEGRDVPVLPLSFPEHTTTDEYARAWQSAAVGDEGLDEELLKSGHLTAVLRLENASKNLTITDFRRLIPQGKHIGGWTLSAGDIINVTPSRSSLDLTQEGWYYILFSSPYSAGVYRHHAMKLYELERQRANGNSFHGKPLQHVQKINEDPEAAIASWGIITTSQSLRLHHLRAPLHKRIASAVEAGGLPRLVSRANKKPFELRMTLEGPQIRAHILRNLLVQAGHERGLPWSGSRSNVLNLSVWEPARDKPETEEVSQDVPAVVETTQAAPRGDPKARYRTNTPTYIVGFEIEEAAQSFLHYWHRRPLCEPSHEALSIGSEAPPILDIEMLW